MILKVVFLFLIAIAVLAMFGKLRLGTRVRRATGRCPACGRFRIGRGPCACGGDNRG